MRALLSLTAFLVTSAFDGPVPVRSEERGEDASACAVRAACLAVKLLGREVTDGEIRECFDQSVSGLHSYEEIATAIHRLGLSANFARVNPEAPDLARLPLIALEKKSTESLQADHFVVLYGRNEESIQVLDFPFPPRFVPCSVFARAWDGGGLYVARSEDDLPRSSFGHSWLPHALAAGAAGVLAVSVLFVVRAWRGGSGKSGAWRANTPSTM